MQRILLVEDDPTTAAFLAAAARGVPAEVDVAGSCAEALAIAGDGRRCDLWLIDAHLPDGDGAGLLAALRDRGPDAPALAHTAATEPAVLDALRAAGFRDVLVKPLSAPALQAAIGDALGPRVQEAAATFGPPAWDDAAALAALNGEQAHVEALRKLFLGELPATRDAVRAAVSAGDEGALRACLHRLRASCGFVGAARIAAAVSALQSDPRGERTLAEFIAAADATLASG